MKYLITVKYLKIKKKRKKFFVPEPIKLEAKFKLSSLQQTRSAEAIEMPPRWPSSIPVKLSSVKELARARVASTVRSITPSSCKSIIDISESLFVFFFIFFLLLFLFLFLFFFMTLDCCTTLRWCLGWFSLKVDAGWWLFVRLLLLSCCNNNRFVFIVSVSKIKKAGKQEQM